MLTNRTDGLRKQSFIAARVAIVFIVAKLF